MALPKLLSLWIFLLFSPCIAAGTPQLDQKHSAAEVREKFTRRLGGTTQQLGGMCTVLAQTYSGYECTDYEVQTKDGYILSLSNIQSSREGLNTSSTKQPVVVQHGIVADGMSWFVNPPFVDQSIGFILADAGFDVWISNTRGTRFSRRHVSLDAAMPEYWNWSWDQLSQYDLPAVLGFVFDKTKKKMHYIGHSMGATQALAAFTEGRELDKLKSASLFCPVTYFSHLASIGMAFACKAFLGELTFVFGIPEFNLKMQPAAAFMNDICNLPAVNCLNMLDPFTGPNCCLNNSQISFVLQHEPQPSSTKCLVHFCQLHRDGKFRKYDYGSSMVNNEYYGQSEPPEYNLTKIPNDFPLNIMYGALDMISNTEDVNQLLHDLKGHDQNKLRVQMVPQYAHLDFIGGTTAKDVIYIPLVQYLKSQD